MKPLFAAALLCALPTFGFAHDYTAGNIEVHHPYAFETAPMARTAAGYMSITNTGVSADRLIAIEADFPKVMIHESRETDGVATMSHIETLDIAAGQSVEFAPGGYHVMFMGLDGQPIEDGAKIPATLVFEQAGRIDVEFNVQAREDVATEAPSGHATH
jgi:hypothetical protein